MSGPLLEGRDVTVRFGRGADTFEAVRDASLTLHPGEIVGVVGESGSGKTTLARVLVGLQQVASGTVLLEGKQVVEARSRESVPKNERWKVQMVFQDPYSSLNPRMRAWSAVAEALQVWREMTRKQARMAAFTLLQSIGIDESQARRFPKALSGGQRQRVSIARALAPEPKVLIADEPTSAIDQSAQARLANLLRRLRSERNLAILFISHDLALVRYLTSRVHVMRRGRIVESGPTEAVLRKPQHAYTRVLLDSLPGRREEAISNRRGEAISNRRQERRFPAADGSGGF